MMNSAPRLLFPIREEMGAVQRDALPDESPEPQGNDSNVHHGPPEDDHNECDDDEAVPMTPHETQKRNYMWQGRASLIRHSEQ